MSDIFPIAIPKWGIEMVEGTIAGWKKAAGDTVAKGDEIVEIESDKIVNVWEAPIDGVLRRVLVGEGETRKVGELLGVIAPAGASDADVDAFVAGYGGAKSPAAASLAAPAAVTAASPAAATRAADAAGANAVSDAARRVNPVVRRLAEELGVNLDAVAGTGRNGRITTEDVEAAAKAGATAAPAAAAAGDDVTVIPLSATRKTIARRLTEAKQQIPHFYLTAEFEIDGLLRHRGELNASGGQKVSVNDLLVWCVARALVAEPRANVNFVNDEIHQFKRAHVAVAIATDDGLYPATVRNADTLSPQEIAARTVDLAAKAKSGTLGRDDLSGASFTVSNLGMYGISSFSAIVNPPQGAILALGKGQARPVVRDGKVEIATIVSATLSCDHRVIDGAVGAQFLSALGTEIAKL